MANGALFSQNQPSWAQPGQNWIPTGPGSWWTYGSGQGWGIPFNTHQSNNYGPMTSGFTAFDQYAPGVNMYRGGGGIQTTLAGGVPITQFGRPINEDPRFADVIAPLYERINTPDVWGGIDPTMVGRDTFGLGIGTLGLGRPGMSPELQRTMDIINQLQNTATNRAASTAQALASRRGLAGSSVEQFGVGSAAAEAQRPFTEQQANVLLSEAQRQQQLRDLQARAFFDRSSLENQANLQRAQIQAGLEGQFGGFDLQRRRDISSLTSDELASLRNLGEAGANRALQLELGNQNIAQANWLASLAQSQARRSGSGFFDSFAPALFGGLGSGFGSYFGRALFA